MQSNAFHSLNKILTRMPSTWMLRRVVLVRIEVLKEGIASIIRVKTIGELGRTLP
jgi:hypothetical protein